MSEQAHQSPNSAQAEDTKTSKKQTSKPKGWIRWSGLIGLLAILGVVFGLSYLASSWALKNKFESMASNAWGAKVEIQNLNLSVNPVGIRLKGVVLTDTEQPMQNLIELEEITLTINLYHAVLGRFVVEDIRLSGLALDQARQTSGALPDPIEIETSLEAVAEEPTASRFKLPSAALPDAKEVVERERLDTVDQAKQLESLSETTQVEWSKIEQDLPTAKSLKQYESDINAIFADPIKDPNDLNQRQQRLENLQTSWKKDQKTVKQAQDFIKQHADQLNQGLRELQQLPSQDLQRLLSTYSMDESGLSNVTYLLFGGSVQQKLQMALDWHRKAQPFIKWIEGYRAQAAEKKSLAEQAKPARLLGEHIAFKEFDPQPKFMIKRIDFNGDLNWGHIDAKVRDLNFNHSVSQKPIRFEVMAQPKSQKTGLLLDGQSSALEGDQLITRVQAEWMDYQVNDWWLAKTDALPVKLASAKASMSGRIQLSGLSHLSSNVGIHYQNAHFDLSTTDSSEVKRYLAPAFSDIEAFVVDAKIEGRLLAPKISASSDLDNQLAAAFNQVFQQEMANFKHDLEKHLQATLATLKQPIEAELSRLNIDQSMLRDREQTIKELDVQAQQKLKQAERELVQRLDTEKKRLEKETKQKVEDELRKRIRLPF